MSDSPKITTAQRIAVITAAVLAGVDASFAAGEIASANATGLLQLLAAVHIAKGAYVDDENDLRVTHDADVNLKRSVAAYMIAARSFDGAPPFWVPEAEVLK